ncbi:hypothetical protein M3P05_18760 [Sansalvadorimonas sp. 2012CJ34-2]|uniref:Uncharacterized protein n=1 Tax=Parendozoicomonas callyspongiae TaxID=2942213 RepID=A0ABT0PKR2_9GAMM|nr:hypothetical protein [Sansalvadorimonas sp. 2012CJ34-2]MCL6271965.1 hypothetical protein [Sansalvadorimonas sp. 2012CJ34-2]
MDGGNRVGGDQRKSQFFRQISDQNKTTDKSQGVTDDQRSVASTESKSSLSDSSSGSDAAKPTTTVQSRKVDYKRVLHKFVDRSNKTHIHPKAVLNEAQPTTQQEREHCLKVFEDEIVKTFKGKNTKNNSHLSSLGNALVELVQIKNGSSYSPEFLQKTFHVIALHQNLAKEREGRIIAREGGQIKEKNIKACMHQFDEILAGRNPFTTAQMKSIATHHPQLYVQLLAAIDLETLTPSELHELYGSLTEYLSQGGEAWEVLQGTEAKQWLTTQEGIMPAFSARDFEESRGYLTQQLIALKAADFTGIDTDPSQQKPEEFANGFTYYPGALTKEFDFTNPAMRTLKALQTAGVLYTTVLQAMTTHTGDHMADRDFEESALETLGCKKDWDRSGTYLMQAVMKEHIPEYKKGAAYQCHLYVSGDSVVTNTDYSQARGGFQVIPVMDGEGDEATVVDYNYPPASWPSIKAPKVNWAGHEQPEFKAPPPKGAPTKYDSDSGVDVTGSSEEN